MTASCKAEVAGVAERAGGAVARGWVPVPVLVPDARVAAYDLFPSNGEETGIARCAVMASSWVLTLFKTGCS